MSATVEDVSGKLIISKFPNRPCFGEKSWGLCNFFRASKICLLPALWACDLKNFLRRLTYLDETSHAVSPWVEYGPHGLWGQKVKGQGHNAWITEKGFTRITASPLHLSWWNFTCSLPMSRVWTLWTSRSKGQRSRSQCKDYWKRIHAHNCFPFTPILMKLHMQSPHESNMDPMDFSVKRSRSQCKDYWKWFLAHNCFPFTPILMKLHMQSPHESSMDPMDFGVKRSKVKVTMQGLLKMVSCA